MKKRFKGLKKVRSPGFLAGLTFFIVIFIFFNDLFDDRYLFAERDLTSYFIPPRFFLAESFKQGDFPLWNPYQFTGSPFWANPQHGVLYPFHSLFLLFPFDTAFNAIIILHFFLGGFFTYLLVRDLGARATGASLSGLIFMLGGYLLSVHSLLTILLSVVWTPLIMLFFRRAMIRPGMGHEILTALFITLSFLGGGIEIVYGNFFVLLLMMVFPGPVPLSSVENRCRCFFLRVRSLLLISVLSLILSALQLFPFIELWIHSIRGQGISYAEATVWSFAPRDFLLFFLPDAYGYFLDMKKYWVTQCWLKTMYTGGLPFILTFFFFRYGTDRKLFLSLMLFSLFISLGQYNPLYRFVYHYVPFFNGIRYPVKFLYLFILCLAITSGLGFEKLIQFSKQEGRWFYQHLLMAFALLSGVVLLVTVLGHAQIEAFLKAKGVDFPEVNHLSINLYHAKRFLFYLTLFFLLLRIGYEVGWRKWIQGMLIFFLITDLFGNMGFYGKEKSQDYFKQTEIQKRVNSDREPGRLFSTAKTISLETPILVGNGIPLDFIKERHLPSLNMMFRIHDIWGVDVVRLKRNDDLYKTIINLPSIGASSLIDLYGVKYVTSVTPIEDPRFELVYARLEGLEGLEKDLLKENTIKLYRHKNPLPRARLLRAFKVIDSKEMLSAMTQKNFDPQKEVFLEDDPYLSFKEQTDQEKVGIVKLISESNNRVSINVNAETECLLILSDTYYPGWKVFVNGLEKKILRANYHFRAVALPRGKHRVEFIYSPWSVKLGGAITFVGILGCLSGWMVLRNKRKLPKEVS